MRLERPDVARLEPRQVADLVALRLQLETLVRRHPFERPCPLVESGVNHFGVRELV